MTLLTTPQAQAPVGRFLLPICTDRAGLAALLSLLHFGAFEAGYLDNEQLFYDVLEALAFIDDPTRAACASPPPPPPDKTTIKEALKRFASGRATLHEEDQDMACNQIIKIGAQWYLYSDCAGCDQPLYFALTPTTLDANAQPIPPADSTKQPGTAITPLPQERATCFASKATPYLLSRAAAFWDSVTDAALIGIDSALGGYDEIAQYAAIAAEMLTGNSDLREIAALGKEAIQDAIQDPATVSALSAAWTFTEPPSKDELIAWTNRAPFLVGVVPVRTALQLWLRFSVVINYGNRLSSMIEQCRQDDPTATTIESYTTSDNAYRVIKYSSSQELTTAPSTAWLAEFDPITIQGIAYHMRYQRANGAVRFAGIVKDAANESEVFEETIGGNGAAAWLSADTPTIRAAIAEYWSEAVALPSWGDPFQTMPRNCEGVGFRVEAAEAQATPYEIQAMAIYIVIAL